jgi:hypothetical protein
MGRYYVRDAEDETEVKHRGRETYVGGGRWKERGG